MIGLLILFLSPQAAQAFTSVNTPTARGSAFLMTDLFLPFELPVICKATDKPSVPPLIGYEIVLRETTSQVASRQGEEKPSARQSFPQMPPISPSDLPQATPTPQAVLAKAEISQAVQPQPTVSVSEHSPGLNADLLFSLINQYRANRGLTPFARNDAVCSIAASRAPQIHEEVYSGHMHAGFYALNLPYRATENIISMRTEQEAFNWWINDPIHHAAIVSDAKYSCVACSGDSCSEIFTSFEPK